MEHQALSHLYDSTLKNPHGAPGQPEWSPDGEHLTGINSRSYELQYSRQKIRSNYAYCFLGEYLKRIEPDKKGSRKLRIQQGKKQTKAKRKVKQTSWQADKHTVYATTHTLFMHAGNFRTLNTVSNTQRGRASNWLHTLPTWCGTSLTVLRNVSFKHRIIFCTQL